MRRRILRSSVLLLACVALSACHVGQNPRPDLISPDSAARADISVTRDAWLGALREGDPDIVSAFFTADARLSQPAAADIVGNDAILAARRSRRAAGNAGNEIRLEPEVVHVAGSNAFEFGDITETVADSAGEHTLRGRYTIHWQRLPEAQWRIKRWLRTDGARTVAGGEGEGR